MSSYHNILPDRISRKSPTGISRIDYVNTVVDDLVAGAMQSPQVGPTLVQCLAGVWNLWLNVDRCFQTSHCQAVQIPASRIHVQQEACYAWQIAQRLHKHHHSKTEVGDIQTLLTLLDGMNITIRKLADVAEQESFPFPRGSTTSG